MPRILFASQHPEQDKVARLFAFFLAIVIIFICIVGMMWVIQAALWSQHEGRVLRPIAMATQGSSLVRV
jgi:hypothetical protein